MNKVTRQVYEYCQKHGLLRDGMGVVAGVSGGADSVCLLLILKELSQELNLKLYAVHIEHGIRGDESRADMEFVKALCERLAVPVAVYSEDVPKRAAELKMTVEEAGRYIRYEAFDKELKSRGADVIAVAHHMGDQAETVLFNMIRGSGLKGMGAMAPVRGKIIRPLLGITRDQIEAYLKENSQDFRIDSTNSDTGYSRNGIRGLVVPELERIVNGAVRHIASVSDELREADDYIRNMADDVRKKAVSVKDPDGKDGTYYVDMDLISKEPPIIRRYVIRSILSDIYYSHKDLEAGHVNDVLSLSDGQSGRSVTLPKGIAARRDGKHIVIGKSDDLACKRGELNLPLNTEGKTYVPGKGEFTVSVEPYDKEQIIPGGLYTKWFDYDKIVDGVFIRNRREGDHLVIDDKGSDKKLKNYLIDEKVPALERDGLILLADGAHIMWIPGMRISSYYKVTDVTKRVMKIEYKGEHNGA